ncbi:MAG: serine/threonine protein kinase [Proteobacteria bacterium]|uniref:serine/threonine-protein kinase n=1 Tax=Rudaea sp. TaxID=2136325 RepID=UPI0032208249|nr:serine/threonine protein kinase [Pseudomonadota bacterium]
MDPRRVGELFDAAIDIAPEERAVWLDRACDGDAVLRAEVECLLRADARASDFLEAPPALIAAASATAAPHGAEGMPHRFGVYRVLRSIGSGGMGEVWLAERSDGEFEQRVAVKQLAWPTPGLLQRFRRERQILARLEHASIARLIDGGIGADGAPYLVMEYVDGVPITDFARARALDVRARLHLFLRVCEAVQYAHQNLVVHRDLKPANIFVTADGTPKLLDFGIAKVLATTDADAPTQTAARLLTPDYAAPEQFTGAAITTATDVYALGVVLYELLADRRPPRADFGMPRDGTQHAGEPPPPSAALDSTAIDANPRRRALRGDLDRIALTAIAAEPPRRYASAEALATDIRRHLEGRPIAARRDSVGYRFRKFARRNRYVLGAAAIAFAACLAAAVVSLRQASIARDEAQRAAAVRQFMVTVFQQANPEENKGRPLDAHQLLEKGEQQMRRRFAGQPALQTDVSALLAQLYVDLGDYARADTLLKQALVASEAARIPDEVRGRVLVSLATLEGEVQSRFADSLAHARQGVALLQPTRERNAEHIAQAHWVMAADLIAQNDSDGAIALLHEAIPRDQAVLGERSEPVAEAWVKLGRASAELERWMDADAAFDQALRIMRGIYGEDSLHAAHVLNEIGSLHYQAGDFARAEEAHRKALQMKIGILDPDNPDTLSLRHNLLGDIEGAGRYAEALPQRLQLLEQAKASPAVAAAPLQIVAYLDGAAQDYQALGRFAEARALLEQALALIDKAQGQRSQHSVTTRSHLGTVLLLQGHFAEAEAAFREALATKPTPFRTCGLRERLGVTLRLAHQPAQAMKQFQSLNDEGCLASLKESDNWRPRALAALAEAQLDSGDTTTANVTADSAMAYARKAFPPHHFQLGIALFAQARARLAAGKPGEAEPLLREALAVRNPPHPADDPRVLEVKVALINALTAQSRKDEAIRLRDEVGPLLQGSASPYAADLRAQLTAH